MKTVEQLERMQRWTMPRLEYRGTVGQILQGGGGKTSTTPYDPGEIRCPPSFCGDKAK